MGKRRDRRTSSDGRSSDVRGWPTHEHDVFTPMGQVEQFGNALRAVRYTDRHRRVSRTVLALMVAPFIILAVVWAAVVVREVVWGSDEPFTTPPPSPPVTAPANPP
jgi:hypothetical protein